MPCTAHPINYAFVLRFVVVCCGLLLVSLTHIPLDNLAEKLQKKFSNAFHSIKMFEFRLKFHTSLILRSPIVNKSTLVRVMTWCRQATSHYLRQCWTSSPTHICGTRGRWVHVTLANMSKTSSESIIISSLIVIESIIISAWQSWLVPRVPMAAQLSVTGVLSVDESMHRLNVTCGSRKQTPKMYHQTSNTRGTKSQNLYVSRLVLQLSLPSPLKTDVRSRMKM